MAKGLWPSRERGASAIYIYRHAFLFSFRAIEKLTGHSLDNHSFSVSYILDVEGSENESKGGPHAQRGSSRGGRGVRESDSTYPGAMGGVHGPQHTHQELPLRLLVPTQFVGAIIGKEGLTIKNITKESQSKWVFQLSSLVGYKSLEHRHRAVLIVFTFLILVNNWLQPVAVKW